MPTDLHSLDVLLLHNAIRHLEKALGYLKEDASLRSELLASLDVSWAMTDLKTVLGEAKP